MSKDSKVKTLKALKSSFLTSWSRPVPQLCQLFVGRRESSPSLVVGHRESSPQLNSPSLSSKPKKLAVDCPVVCSYSVFFSPKRARLKAPAGYGTTHLHKHYEKVCKKRPRKIDIRQSFLKTNQKVSGNQELGTHIFNQEEARHELASMVILHDYPLSVVDHIDFRRYSTCLQPCFNMISRNTLKGDSLKIYKDERMKYYNLLGKIKCRIAITTDMWTSSNNKGFMAVSGHFIDDNWTLQNCILRFLYVLAPHTAEVLADTLVEALMDWNIDRKVSTTTVDNCTTNYAMINHLLQKLPTKDMPHYGKLKHCSLENAVPSDVHSNVNVDDSLDEFEQFVVLKTYGATNSATLELDMYLEESLLPRARDFDILNWWKTNGVKFPTLQKMARDILAILVSTVASESAFSSSGMLINPHRNRLHHTTVEALMCSHYWLWNEANDTCSTSDGIQTCPSILDEKDDQDDHDSK
ncbi:UNVERIFIED_CONTAM: putative AC transposase [Sesamum radiatum]|uniref:AC transposase n=1 Tax=Sesamum radiatum TaxID=300843 RepID=A0AAW2UPF8_SESRA